MSSPSRRTFVIANPTSGAGQVKASWPHIERLLRSTFDELDYAFTRGEGHATMLAEEAIGAGWETIVALGGDGTINEVVNGFYATPDPRHALKLDSQGWLRADATHTLAPANTEACLGIIPMGTGGDFRKSLGVTKDLEKSVHGLRHGRARHIDLCQVGYLDHHGNPALRYFLNIAGAGLPGAVDEAVAKTSKRFGGTASFALGTLRALSRWQNMDVAIELDEEELTDRLSMFIVANGQYFGGGMWVAPHASLQDGKLQVVSLGDVSKAQTVGLLARVYSGRHLGHDKVWHRPASTISIRETQSSSKPKGLLDIDGEQPGRLPACFKVWPGALRLKA